MRYILRAIVAFVVAAFATAALAPLASNGPVLARGGGRGGGGRGGGGNVGGGGGSGRGSGRGGSRGGAAAGGGTSSRGGTQGGTGRGTGTGKKGAKTGVRSSDPVDYLDQIQREEAEAAVPDFVLDALFDSGEADASDDRDELLYGIREKASRARRKASESETHPL